MQIIYHSTPGQVLERLRATKDLSRDGFAFEMQKKDFDHWTSDIVRNLEVGRTRFTEAHIRDLLKAGWFEEGGYWHEQFMETLPNQQIGKLPDEVNIRRRKAADTNEGIEEVIITITKPVWVKASLVALISYLLSVTTNRFPGLACRFLPICTERGGGGGSYTPKAIAFLENGIPLLIYFSVISLVLFFVLGKKGPFATRRSGALKFVELFLWFSFTGFWLVAFHLVLLKLGYVEYFAGLWFSDFWLEGIRTTRTFLYALLSAVCGAVLYMAKVVIFDRRLDKKATPATIETQ